MYELVEQVSQLQKELVRDITELKVKVSKLYTGIIVAVFFFSMYLGLLAWVGNRLVTINDQVNETQTRQLYDWHVENASQINNLWAHINTLEKENKK